MSEPACDYCDEGLPLVDGWHIREDPEGIEGTTRIPCMKPKPRRDLTFREVSAANRSRAKRWHGSFPDPADPWTGADWSNAMQGEAGEAGNVVKKLRRIEMGLWGNRVVDEDRREVLLAKLADEIADTFIYLDLLATYYGVDIAEAIVTKFNRISDAAGFPERLGDEEVLGQEG